MRTWLCAALITTGVIGAAVTGEVGCSSADCSFDATCGQPFDGGADSGIVVPPGCSLEDEPKANPKCVVNSLGVFVSATGGDDTAGDGTKEKPFKTFGKAVLSLSTQQFRLYVCEGNYEANLAFDASRSGLGIYGGFACNDWRYTGGRGKVAAADVSAPALRLIGLTSATVSDMEFSVGDATNDGGSSIAAFVANTDVNFTSVKLSAGKGKAGKSAQVPAFPFPADLDGNPGSSAGPGAAKTAKCQGDGFTTVGGKGGAINGDGDPGTPKVPDGHGGAAGTHDSCLKLNAGGLPGDNGPAGPDGAGAGVAGTLDANGWSAAAGVNGTNGSPGQGGGGGGGKDWGGGGGGAGGCGGSGGPGGQAGGSSIALASFQSSVRFVGSDLVASDGAGAGNGAGGQPGQTVVGAGGTVPGSACPGGDGGKGGKGGTGGGGAGGVSVGVVHSGNAPNVDSATTITIGQGGAKGAGAIPGTHDGIDGPAQKILPL